MKKLKLTVFSIALMLNTTHIQAQWIINGNPTNYFYQLDNTNANNANWVRSAGIGYFGAGFTNSLLHVNSNAPYILPGNGSIANAGEVFRTDGPAGVTHIWRMLNANNTVGDKFFIANPSNTNNINIGGVQVGTLNFYTTSTNGINPINMRQRILGGYNAQDGLIGLGDMGTGAVPFAPQSQVHQHRDGNVNMYHQFTNGNTGKTNTDGFRIGLEYNLGINNSLAVFRQQENAPTLFYSAENLANPVNQLERVRITQGTWNDPGIAPTVTSVTRMSISYGSNSVTYPPITAPWSILHLGRNDTPNNIQRPWMNIGTTYTDNLDAAYFGMFRNPGNDQTDAVVAWADNAGVGAGPDNLRFIFLAGLNPAFGQPGTREGLEVGRFAPNGNFGVGNFFNPGIQPLRRIDALDQGANTPQLRLTHSQNADVNLGVNTDFQTMSTGDLFIHPSSNGTANNRFVGINTSTPGNTLELNALGANGSASQYIPGKSGLRFNDMNNSSPADASAVATKFLTVDANGDVILDDAPTAPTNFVMPCGGALPLNYLTKATGSNTICNTVVHEANDHDIGIGTQNTSGARLQVLSDNGSIPGAINDNQGGISVINSQHANSTNTADRSLFLGSVQAIKSNVGAVGISMSISSNSGLATGIYTSTTSNNTNATGFTDIVTGNAVDAIGADIFVNSNGGNSDNCYGIKCSVPSGNSDKNIGGTFSALDGINENTGVNAYAQASNNTAILYGVKSNVLRAQGLTGVSYGIKVAAVGGTDVYGVWSEALAGTSNNWAFWSNGNSWATGAWQPSDSIFKKNINPINNAMATIMTLDPKKYDYDLIKYPQVNFDSGSHYGLIAQDLAKLIPTLVKKTTFPKQLDSLGNVKYQAFDFNSINYIELIPILIAGIKEQQVQINSLQAQISACCALTQGNTKAQPIAIELANTQTIILNQNAPNPYKDETTITFNIPEHVGNAAILFYDAKGVVLKEVKITSKGAGSIHVYAPDLSSGIYTYTLIADGKVIDSKKMMKE